MIRIKLSDQTIDLIVSLYIKGLGTESIAKQLSVSSSVVQKYVRQAGVLKSKQKYSINEGFFDSYTEESCYWAGFIAADGYIRKDRNLLGIHLSRYDEVHLEKFLKAISSNHKILYDNHTDAACIQIYNPQIVYSLKTNFNITPQKSKTLLYPNIPCKFNKHFIRGVIDGDGSISYTTTSTISLCGATTFLTTIRDIWHNEVNIRTNRSNYHNKLTVSIPYKEKPYFSSISVSGNNANIVGHWLYDESSDLLRLERKYIKYKELIDCLKNE